MPSDLDELFARIDSDPTLLKPADIDQIISWQRQQRANKISGVHKAAKKDTGPGKSVADVLAAAGLSAKSGVPAGFKRRA